MTIPQLDLLFQTTRYLSSQQILYRFYYLVRKRYWRFAGKRAPASSTCPLMGYHSLYLGLQDSTKPGPWGQEAGEALDRAMAVAQQRFHFLNQEVLYPERVNWHDSGVNQLWRYHLHYFDYVDDLLLWASAGNDSAAWDAFYRLVESWIVSNEKIAGDGWHPFTISVRVVNWLNAFQFWKSRFDSDVDFTRRFAASLHGQASILASSLEFDVRGNHLLKNLRALIWCGLAFEDAKTKQWMDRAMEILERELVEQVLGDGAHFERAPGYHAAVLKDCIEMGLWLRRNLPDSAFLRLDEALERMLHYLKSILPPDGKLPLLKDTAWGVTPESDDLLAAGALYFNNPEFKISDKFGIYPLLLFGARGWEIFQSWPSDSNDIPSVSLPESGYHIMRDTRAGNYLVFDGGKVCPDYLPAHAHADMFSYELVVKGQRVVVDSGIYEYTAGKWRDYFRSTPAHNTVTVEKQNQSEVWGSFRVARRARPLQVSWKQEENHILLQAKHDGYRRLPVPILHRRILVWERGRFWLVVDELSQGERRTEPRGRKSEDSVRRGRVQAESHVHFHPTIRPVQIGLGHWQLEGLPFPLWIQAFEHQDHRVDRGRMEPFIQGWYSEKFGERVSNSVLTFDKKASLPLFFGYLISLEDDLCLECTTDGAQEREIRIKDGSRVYKLKIDPDDARYLS